MPIVYWTIVAVTAWIGAVPLLLLMMKVHDHKMVSLDALSAARPRINASGVLDDVEEFASTYAAVDAADLLPVGIGTAKPFMAFLATSLAGFFQRLKDQHLVDSDPPLPGRLQRVWRCYDRTESRLGYEKIMRGRKRYG